MSEGEPADKPVAEVEDVPSQVSAHTTTGSPPPPPPSPRPADDVLPLLEEVS